MNSTNTTTKKNKQKKSNKFSILFRYEMILGLMLVFALLIVLELTRTTFILDDQFKARAAEFSEKEGVITPARGRILSDNGSILAADVTTFVARLDFGSEGTAVDSLRKHLPALCDSLAHFRPGKTSKEWQETLTREINKRKDTAFPLFSRLEMDDINRLKKFPYFNLKGVNTGFYYEGFKVRKKPFGLMASRSIGKVEEDTLTREIHGASGLEKALDPYLYGEKGVSRRVQVTSGMAKVVKKPTVPGYDVTTTINVALQDIVEEQLLEVMTEVEAEWGTCVLMEVATGEIKAISNLQWSKRYEKYIEGINHAVLGYEPGSVMKPISMMIALEDGLVNDINQPIQTGRLVTYEGRNITDPHGGAALTPRQIIETSSNIGMSKIITSGFSKDKGFAKEPDKFRQRLEEMGFFEPFNTGIFGEREPVVHKMTNSKADHVALTRVCYGYSTLIPPLHTLAMYNAIANNGHYVCPRLVKKFSREGEPDSIVGVRYVRHRVCDSINAAKLRLMLHDVVWGEHGTGRSLRDDEVELSGKTGTCYATEKVDSNKSRYTNKKRVTFCGFFPYEQPRYSCIVLMYGANRGAAGASGRVMLQVAKKLYSRGLLGIKAKNKEVTNPANATFYASSNTKRRQDVTSTLNLRQVNTFSTPNTATGNNTVPNVRGLCATEAINKLERAGLLVNINGSGYVSGQSIAPGTPFKRGQSITLSLSHE
ncbi:MAG: penicillin-binding protein [Muribaculaceae bacterium]